MSNACPNRLTGVRSLCSPTGVSLLHSHCPCVGVKAATQEANNLKCSQMGMELHDSSSLIVGFRTERSRRRSQLVKICNHSTYLVHAKLSSLLYLSGADNAKRLGQGSTATWGTHKLSRAGQIQALAGVAQRNLCVAGSPGAVARILGWLLLW